MDIAATVRPEIMFVRNLSCAGLMTFGLLYFMHLLIDTGVIDDPVDIAPIAPIIAVKHVIEEIKKEPKPKRPLETLDPPPVVPRQIEDYRPETGDFGDGLGYQLPKDITGGGINISAGGIIQQVMVPPTYPSRALAKGIEGYVDVRFEVTAMGSTQQVTVLRSEPAGVFDRSAVRAVKRWKYLPDEERAQAETLQERIRFLIEQ